MKIKELESVSIIGLGLLGGSLGLSVERSFPRVRRVGYSHQLLTRQKALDTGVVDKVCPNVSEAVADAQLVILASPIGTFADLMRQMSGKLPKGCVVTDVGSTKMLPVRQAEKIFDKTVSFIGSHPM
ncbi:MAG: prephenate dehydrogenase/arogenate dehydrogenase family protein, partial [Planctomycetes bacterium]|nr:prephenate dehydrogenase/arogenate dehydrogenase family protein [Planctomycetota bacterium]